MVEQADEERSNAATMIYCFLNALLYLVEFNAVIIHIFSGFPDIKIAGRTRMTTLDFGFSYIRL